MNKEKNPVFKTYEKAGVIYVMERAQTMGFNYLNPDWSNLGQGSPETTALKGALKRIEKIECKADDHGYAPVAGLKELRKNIAQMYNDLFRKNKASKYTFENINIAGGGRMAISRVIACLDNAKIGYLIPDYASYEGILSAFNNSQPVPIFLDPNNGYKIRFGDLKEKIIKHKIKALLLSNPSNPTGALIKDQDLKRLVMMARKYNFYLIIDEFYFNYIYEKKFRLISSSEFINKVNTDPVIIISGLSKAWRYSGWRICWAIGPKQIMDSVSSVGSFLDGGANNPLQKEAIKLISKKNIIKESKAIQKTFKKKRDYMLTRLKSMGFIIENNPEGSFYIWANVQNLPEPLNFSINFFEECLKENVISVPGKFFDLNPYKARKHINFRRYIRFSFGPDMTTLKNGLDSIERTIKKYS